MQHIHCVQYKIGLYVKPPEWRTKIMIWLDVTMTKTSRHTLYDMGISWCLDDPRYSQHFRLPLKKTRIKWNGIGKCYLTTAHQRPLLSNCWLTWPASSCYCTRNAPDFHRTWGTRLRLVNKNDWKLYMYTWLTQLASLQKWDIISPLLGIAHLPHSPSLKK